MKAYKRLVVSGRILGRKGPPTLFMMSTASSSASVGAAEDETDEHTEPDTDITAPSEEEENAAERDMGDLTTRPETPSSAGLKSETASEYVSTQILNADDGWTTVGNPGKKAKKAVGHITLVHNGGLTKMNSPITPLDHRRHRGFATSYDHLH